MSQTPVDTPHSDLWRENQELRLRLQEAEEVLAAIGSGEVDALVVQGSEGPRIFTLQGADQVYRTLIEEMNEGALLLDQHATIVYANTCLATLLERALPELIGASLWEWIPADYGAYFRELLVGGWEGLSKGELPMRTRSGRLRPFSLSMSALPTTEAPVLGVIVTDLSAQREIRTIRARVRAQNRIIERKDAELQLGQAAHAEAQRLGVLLAQAPVAIAIFRGPDYRIELANRAYRALWGRTEEEVLGKPLFEALPEARGQGYEELLNGVLATGEPFHANEQSARLARNGRLERVYFNFVFQPLREAAGAITGVIMVAHDITEQVESRRQVEEKKRFETLLESIPQITWTALPTGEINFYNARWYAYTGLNYAQTQAWGWQAVLHPEDLPATLKTYRRALRTGEAFELECRLKRGDGTYRWHLSRTLPLGDERDITGWVGTATDIDEQKRLAGQLQATTQELTEVNRQLVHTNVDLDNFIYTASHDLKAPISNIEGLLAALLRLPPAESLASERAQRITALMQESVERFKKTITNLTAVVKLQKENSGEVAIVDLPEVIREVMLDLEPTIQSSGAQLSIDVGRCPSVHFSEKNLRSVVYNLLSNALKYCSPERVPRVGIHCGRTPEYQVLTVEDNGLGMDLSGDHKLFSMFKRFHDHVEGSGIGLYMVKKMVENAGGKIEVESRPGVGTTFRVYFKD